MMPGWSPAFPGVQSKQRRASGDGEPAFKILAIQAFPTFFVDRAGVFR